MSKMSLFIVGSCSALTRSIVSRISSQYKLITIGDLLPVYDYHYRFYDLQKDVEDSALSLRLTKLIQLRDIAHLISTHDQLLFVTHDYYTLVTSKTTLLEKTAALAKSANRRLVVATALQYEFMAGSPFANGMPKFAQLAPDATIVRARTPVNSFEFASYLNEMHKNKNQILFTSGKTFVGQVVQALNNKQSFSKEIPVALNTPLQNGTPLNIANVFEKQRFNQYSVLLKKVIKDSIQQRKALKKQQQRNS